MKQYSAFSPNPHAADLNQALGQHEGLVHWVARRQRTGGLPWADVLQWFAEQAGLSLVMNAPPQGTFNYTDDHEYTPAEAIDLPGCVGRGHVELPGHGNVELLEHLEAEAAGVVRPKPTDQLGGNVPLHAGGAIKGIHQHVGIHELLTVHAANPGAR